MYTEQIVVNCDDLIYPLVQKVYITDLFTVDGLIYPFVQNVYKTGLFNVDIHLCRMYTEHIVLMVMA